MPIISVLDLARLTPATSSASSSARPPFIPYVTILGDRWDLIAWKFYGSYFIPAIGALLAANPGVPISAVIPQGTRIAVPILGDQSVQPTDLPPWETL